MDNRTMGMCVVCGVTAKLSREHVLPSWIGSTAVGEGPLTIRQNSKEGELREHQVAKVDMVVRVVCKE